MAGIILTIIIITLNACILKYSNQKAKIVRLNKKQDPRMGYLQEAHYRFKDTKKSKEKEWKKYTMQTATTRKLK